MAAKLVFLAVAALCCIQASYAASLALDTDAIIADAKVQIATLETQLEAALNKITESEEQGYRSIVSCAVALVKAVGSVKEAKELIDEYEAIEETLSEAETACATESTEAEQTACVEEAKTTANEAKIKLALQLPSFGISTAAEIAALSSCLSVL